MMMMIVMNKNNNSNNSSNNNNNNNNNITLIIIINITYYTDLSPNGVTTKIGKLNVFKTVSVFPVPAGPDASPP
jgi:hypothetical protein